MIDAINRFAEERFEAFLLIYVLILFSILLIGTVGVDIGYRVKDWYADRLRERRIADRRKARDGQ